MNASKTPRVYVETSVWSFQFADDAPEKREITRQFFEEARRGLFELYASDVVVQELRAASEPRRAQLFALLDEVGPTLLDVSAAAVELSQEYIRAGAIPERYANDALHVAVATVEDMDIVLSWNMKHIVRSKTRRQVHGINLVAGYHEIEISTPEMEVTTSGEVSDEH